MSLICEANFDSKILLKFYRKYLTLARLIEFFISYKLVKTFAYFSLFSINLCFYPKFFKKFSIN